MVSLQKIRKIKVQVLMKLELSHLLKVLLQLKHHLPLLKLLQLNQKISTRLNYTTKPTPHQKLLLFIELHKTRHILFRKSNQKKSFQFQKTGIYDSWKSEEIYRAWKQNLNYVRELNKLANCLECLRLCRNLPNMHQNWEKAILLMCRP